MLTTSDIKVDLKTPSSERAVELRHASKAYPLYTNMTDQFLDALGFQKFAFLRPKGQIKYHHALDAVSLSINAGERVGVIGRNGAGKTTLLKLISGAAQPTSGTVTIGGNVQALMHVGVGFHPDFTGIDNIRASLLYSGLSNEERAAAEAEIIEFVELADYLHQPLKTYSLGMQSRLQFACATAIKPEILIVDEILGAGDAYFSVKSSMRMEKLTKSGCTLLLVSHSMQQVIQFCERVIWIDGGKVYRDGPARDVVGEYEVQMQKLTEHLVHPGNSKNPGASYRLATAKPAMANVPSSDPLPETAPLTAPQDPYSIRDFELQIREDNGSLRETLADGRSVFRWPSEEGIKLSKIGIFANGRAVEGFLAGDSPVFEGELECEIAGRLACYYHIAIFRLDGLRVTRLTSPIDVFEAQPGGKRSFRVILDPCRLLDGDYYINFSIMDGDQPKDLPTRRFDLVARFCDFKVGRILSYTEDGIFSHDSDWTIGDLR